MVSSGKSLTLFALMMKGLRVPRAMSKFSVSDFITIFLVAISLGVVFIVSKSTVASAQPSAQGYALTSAVIFDTIGYPADGTIRTITWRNDTDATIYIRKAYLWIGMYHGARADSDATVTRQSDGVIVAKMQWDHYAEPVAPTSQIFNFEPGYIALDAGDGLMLTYYTTPLDKDAALFMAAAQFIMWWSKE